jgi:hypothetical protein
MGANPAAGKEQGVAFAYGMNGALIIAFPDLGDIQRDVDLSGTNLPAGCQKVLLLIEMEQAFGGGFNREYVFGAGALTGPAPHAFFFVHNGEPVRSYFQCVKQTGLYTVPVTEAPLVTLTFSLIQHHLCPA